MMTMSKNTIIIKYLIKSDLGRCQFKLIKSMIPFSVITSELFLQDSLKKCVKKPEFDDLSS